MINLTKQAADQIRDIIKEQELNPDDTYLRIGVRGGGCAGFEYILDLTSATTESDEIMESNEIKIACDQRSLLYLSGTSIDFQDGLMGKGFVFNNPAAVSKCGCGSSFSV